MNENETQTPAADPSAVETPAQAPEATPPGQETQESLDTPVETPAFPVAGDQ